MSIYYDMPILLIVVAFVYSATRHDRWDRIVKEAARWLLHICLFLGGIGVVLYFLSTWLGLKSS